MRRITHLASLPIGLSSARKMSRLLCQRSIHLASPAPSPGLDGASGSPHPPAATTITIREDPPPQPCSKAVISHLLLNTPEHQG